MTSGAGPADGTLLVAMEDTLLAVTLAGDGVRSREAFTGRPLRCLAAHPARDGRAYLGTADDGLWSTSDAGVSWRRPAAGPQHADVTAVAVAPHPRNPGAVWYAGCSPSTMYRSDDAGERWRQLAALSDLPSAASWSFPPRPDTHHVRWIEADPRNPERIFVAIEAGALIRSRDGGRSWIDRPPEAPRDTHTLRTSSRSPDVLHAAAGDGYFESRDGGDHWQRPEQGLEHRYLWGCALAEDGRTVLVSAARSARHAHDAERADSRIYRRRDDGAWQAVHHGLPDPSGTTISTLLADPHGHGALYAANNRGVFRSTDAGASWTRLPCTWPRRFANQRVVCMAMA